MPSEPGGDKVRRETLLNYRSEHGDVRERCLEARTVCQEARSKAGMTRKELAQNLGVSIQVIEDLERDGYIPAHGVFNKLQKLLKVTLPRSKAVAQKKVAGPKTPTGTLTLAQGANGRVNYKSALNEYYQKLLRKPIGVEVLEYRSCLLEGDEGFAAELHLRTAGFFVKGTSDESVICAEQEAARIALERLRVKAPHLIPNLEQGPKMETKSSIPYKTVLLEAVVAITKQHPPSVVFEVMAHRQPFGVQVSIPPLGVVCEGETASTKKLAEHGAARHACELLRRAVALERKAQGVPVEDWQIAGRKRSGSEDGDLANLARDLRQAFAKDQDAVEKVRSLLCCDEKTVRGAGPGLPAALDGLGGPRVAAPASAAPWAGLMPARRAGSPWGAEAQRSPPPCDAAPCDAAPCEKTLYTPEPQRAPACPEPAARRRGPLKASAALRPPMPPGPPPPPPHLVRRSEPTCECDRSTSPSTASTIWEEYADPATGRSWWWNPSTEEVRWDNPI